MAVSNRSGTGGRQTQLLGLGERRRAAEQVPGPGMAILGQGAYRDGSDVPLVDQ
jgi:hypothetical protein